MVDSSPPVSAVYAHRGTNAVQRMVEYAPATGSLALWAKHRNVDDERAVIACNDGTTISYGPGFDTLSIARQTGMVAHQVLHVALCHAPRYLALQSQLGDVDLELYNLCADAIVNSALGHLSWLELEPNCIKLETLLSRALNLQLDPHTALLAWDLERLYRAIDDRAPRSPSKPQQSGGMTTSPQQAATPKESEVQPRARRADGPKTLIARILGRHGANDLVPNEASERPETQTERAREWRERILRGHTDDGPVSLLRALLADLPQVHTPWEQLLRVRLAHGLSRQPAPSWSRPARSYIANQGRLPGGGRMPWEPGWSTRKAVARLALMIDVSGSIDQGLLQRFAGEIAAITRRLEAAAVIVIGDNRVRRVVHFEPGRTRLDDIECNGGGGTDFTPLLEEASRWRPDIGVFLTDLEGPANHRPGYPVIWAVPAAQSATRHPFGSKLILK